MLSKKYRFHRQNDVKRVYARGDSARSGPFGLKYMKQSKPADDRIAVVVSKKIDKRAVVRNRIRRRVYEIIRNQLPEMKQGYDLVITVFNVSVARENSQELKQRIIKLLHSAELMK